MRVSYDKLWKKLIDEKMNKRDLMRRAKVSTNIIAKMGKEEPIALESVRRSAPFSIAPWMTFWNWI